MRLIDADKAKEKAECYNWDTVAIDNAPTVDAVPVIRCKDCFYYQQANLTGEEWKWCMVHHNYTEEENFCSWAERKEE